MRRPEGITLIAVFHFVVAGLSLIGALGVLLFSTSAVAVPGGNRPTAIWPVFVLGTGLLFFVGWAMLSLVVGWGLVKLKEWARLLTIGLSALALFLFPIGTAIGGLIIWYLIQQQVVAAFRAPDPFGTGA
jgi:hypothetical protein